MEIRRSAPLTGQQQNAPGSCCAAGGVPLWVGKEKRGEKENENVGFYAAFAGAKTRAFFRRVCMERTMQLRVKLMTK